jgi:hypothetical protein
MIRGTTPTLEFVLPMDTGQLEEAFVTVSQNNKAVIEKNLRECKCKGPELTVKLKQEDTLKLTSGVSAVIVLVIKTLGGDRFESVKFMERVEETTKDGVI